MSKFVKNLISEHLASRLQGVGDLLLVNVIGLDANKAVVLRKQLRQKNVQLMVVKNSLARRAAEGTPLSPAFAEAEGTLAVVWGSDDIVSLAKIVTEFDADPRYEAFKAKGGVMDGEALTAERVREISKWPSRGEQLSLLVGQILGPGATLSAQLLGPGAKLASQVKKKSEGADEAAAEASAAAEAPAAAPSPPAEPSPPAAG